jgi:predicted dehydrogenase
MGARARGSVTASQVSAGRKNRLSVEIYGTKSSVAWNQERPDELWAGHRDAGNQIVIKDPSLLKPAKRAAMPIFPAATAKATTTRSSKSSAASMLPLEPRSATRSSDGIRSSWTVLQAD